jgi:hypothetical protein
MPWMSKVGRPTSREGPGQFGIPWACVHWAKFCMPFITCCTSAGVGPGGDGGALRSPSRRDGQTQDLGWAGAPQ